MPHAGQTELNKITANGGNGGQYNNNNNNPNNGYNNPNVNPYNNPKFTVLKTAGKTLDLSAESRYNKSDT